MKFSDLKHMVFEGDDEGAATTGQPSPPSTPAGPPTYSWTPTIPIGTPVPISTPIGDSSAAVAFDKRLTDRTDFDQTSAGKLLKECEDPLKALPLDDKTRLKTALQYGLSKGLTADAIMQAIDSLYHNLDSEAQGLAAAMQQQTEKEITARQTSINQWSEQIKNLQAQIADLQSKQAQTSTELVTQQANIESKKIQFNASIANHKVALDQLKAKFVALLQP